MPLASSCPYHHGAPLFKAKPLNSRGGVKLNTMPPQISPVKLSLQKCTLTSAATCIYPDAAAMIVIVFQINPYFTVRQARRSNDHSGKPNEHDQHVEFT